MKKLTVEIEDEQHRRLKRVALERDESMAEILRRLLEAYLPEQEAELFGKTEP